MTVTLQKNITSKHKMWPEKLLYIFEMFTPDNQLRMAMTIGRASCNLKKIARPF